MTCATAHNMIRATTPKHIFIFEVDPSEFKRILITYEQDGHIVMEKDQDDLTFESETDDETGETIYTAWYRLSQEETAKFLPEQTFFGTRSEKHTRVSVQVRVLTTSDEALASDKKTLNVQDVLNDEVLV